MLITIDAMRADHVVGLWLQARTTPTIATDSRVAA